MSGYLLPEFMIYILGHALIAHITVAVGLQYSEIDQVAFHKMPIILRKLQPICIILYANMLFINAYYFVKAASQYA